jgi:RNA polymerase sigma factor (sigma-70 family)
MFSTPGLSAGLPRTGKRGYGSTVHSQTYFWLLAMSDDVHPRIVARLASDDAFPPDNRVVVAESPGDHSATIDQLYRTQAARLVRLVSHRTRNRNDALDIVHDAFMRLASLGNKLRQVNVLEAYLARVTGNLVKDNAKSAAARIQMQSVVLSDLVMPVCPPEPMLEARDMLARLEVAMRKLKPRTREIFMAHRLDGLTYAEIAERTGLSVKGVECQMSNAIAKLDRLMDFD